jgi:hypothetical protein
VQLIGYALVSSLLVGIARAWELVGGVDTGVIASIAVLSGHRPGARGPGGVAAPEALGTIDAGDAPGPGLMVIRQANAASEPRPLLLPLVSCVDPEQSR